MAEQGNSVISALLAFAGGFLAGVLLAPDTGAKTREKLAGEARVQLSRLEGQVKNLTNQLDGLQEQIREASGTMTERVRDVADKAVAAVGDEVEQNWEVHDEDVSKDLRRMPRK